MNSQKRTLYKKGITATGFLASVVIMGLVVWVSISILEQSSDNTKGVMSKYMESLSSDYDQDGITDFYDKSPCVAGEDEVVASDGKLYDYFGPVIDDGGDGTCKFREYNTPNGGVAKPKSEWIFPGLMDGSLDIDSLKKVQDVSLHKDVCVLEEKDCSRWLRDYYEAMKESKKKD